MLIPEFSLFCSITKLKHEKFTDDSQCRLLFTNDCSDWHWAENPDRNEEYSFFTNITDCSSDWPRDLLSWICIYFSIEIRKPVQVEPVPPVATEVVPDASWLKKSNTMI